jgi:hypothetical protein
MNISNILSIQIYNKNKSEHMLHIGKRESQFLFCYNASLMTK